MGEGGEDHKVNPSKDHKQRSPKSDRTNSAFQSKVIKNPQKIYKYYLLSRQFHRLTSSIVIKVIKPIQKHEKSYILSRQLHRHTSSISIKVIKPSQKLYKYDIVSTQPGSHTSIFSIKVIPPPPLPRKNSANINFSPHSFTGTQAAFQSRS